MWWRSVIFSGLLFGSIAAAIPSLLWVVTALVASLAGAKVSYSPFGWAAAALVTALWSALTYGHNVGMWKVEVNDVVYESESVPKEFDGYKIVHISDLHTDTFDGKPEALEAIVRRINALDADLILFTGDMQTGHIDATLRHGAVLSRLVAKDGVKSVLGNHDFFIYDRELQDDEARSAMADSLTKFEREELGWTVLRNENVSIRRGEAGIVIAGVDNINGNQGFQTIQKGDLKKALDGVPEDSFTVLLSHDPSHWTAEVLPESNVDITLSGHTHAAQIRLFGHSLASLSFKEYDGRYDDNGRMLYVNAGIGCTVPFRIGCPSEITLIRLVSSSSRR